MKNRIMRKVAAAGMAVFLVGKAGGGGELWGGGPGFGGGGGGRASWLGSPAVSCRSSVKALQEWVRERLTTLLWRPI